MLLDKMLVVGLVLVGGGVVPAQSTKQDTPKTGAPKVERKAQQPKPPAKVAPKLPAISKAGRLALREAKQVARGAKGKRGLNRRTILTEAAAAYEKVGAQFAKDAGCVARASFEAAELWRKTMVLDKAAAAYKRAMQHDPVRFQERSLLNLAHLERRQSRLPQALQIYKQVAAMKTDSRRILDARMWVGRCLEKLGKAEAAVQGYRSFLAQAKKPRHIIKLGNRLAGLFVRRSQLPEAQKVLQQVASRVEPIIAAGGTQGAALDKALQKMSVRRALQRALDRQNRAAKDAEQLEKARRPGSQKVGDQQSGGQKASTQKAGRQRTSSKKVGKDGQPAGKPGAAKRG